MSEEDFLPVLACRPVDLEPMFRLAPAMRDQPLPIYADSTEEDCEECGTRIYVGPKIRAMKEQQPEALLICMLCVATTAQRNAPVELTVHHLGNTDYAEGETPP